MIKCDVAIVGSGLGGLLTGLILSKEGMNVCVLEQNKQVGGLLQTFKRDGIIFDTGVHFVGSLGEGEVLNQYFKYFGILDQLKIRKMDESGFDELWFKEKCYKYANGFDRFKETLAADFPKEREALDKYVEKIQSICNSHALFDLHEVDGSSKDFSHLMINAWDYIRSITNDEMLRQVLAGTNFLYAGISSKTPMLIHSLVNSSYIRSSWKFVDGSYQIAGAIIRVIKKNGGSVLNQKKVVRFVTEGNKVKYLLTDEGEEIYANNFISNLHPAVTLSMLDTNKISKPYRKRVLSLENTMSTFILYIKFNENTFRFLNKNIYYFSKNSVWTAENLNPEHIPEFYLLTTPASDKTGEYSASAIAMTYMAWEEVVKWENTNLENRGEDYEEFKIKKSEQLIDLLEKKYPNIRQCIQKYWSSTPLTIRDYTGSPQGSLYGIMKDSNNPMKAFISQKTKLPNLFLTGQNVNFHGVVGVTISAALTCSEFLGLNYLIRKIKNA